MSWDLDLKEDYHYCTRCDKEMEYYDTLYSDMCEECEKRIDEVPDYIPPEQVDKYIEMKMAKEEKSKKKW